MLGSTDISGQASNIQPYVFTDVNGTTKYTGVSISFGDGSMAVWQIKKEWASGTVMLMGFPDGSQDFAFIWNNRASYTYK
jgi:hypothetical protein